MKNRVIKCIVLLLFISTSLFSKENTKDPVVLTIDKQEIPKSEFLRIYNKNNTQSASDSKSVKEYLEMFINYKLKVVEAESLKLDTMPSFIKEYEGYRDQLAKPYLTDNAAEAMALQDLYKHMTTELDIKQIVIKLSTPNDTLTAFNKAITARNEIVKGIEWDSVAFKYSDDPNVRKSHGKVGFVSAVQPIPYSIEKALYSLKKGEISMPIKANTGYFLLYLIDTRPSVGEIKVAHIMSIFPENAATSTADSAKMKIDDFYSKIKAGAKFEDVAMKYSDDKRSASKGGELNWFGANQMVGEFEAAAFALKNDGDISEPIKTSYGWHIIKRISKRAYPSFEEQKEKLKQRIERDERSQMGKLSFISNVKKDANVKEFTTKLKLVYPFIDSTFVKGKWDVSKVAKIGKEKLLVIDDKTYTVTDFIIYLLDNLSYNKTMNVAAVVESQYKEYSNNIIIEFEKGRLPSKYPDYKYLTQEYHDGILLFNLMEQKIWTKASTDTIGLDKFFKENNGKYKWGERIEGIKVSSANKDLVSAALALAQSDLNIKAEDLINKICIKDSTKSCISANNYLIEKGENQELDSIGWAKGTSNVLVNGNLFSFYIKKDIKASTLKQLPDAKGIVIADYQAYLEEQYIAELRKKHNVKINTKEIEALNSSASK